MKKEGKGGHCSEEKGGHTAPGDQITGIEQLIFCVKKTFTGWTEESKTLSKSLTRWGI